MSSADQAKTDGDQPGIPEDRDHPDTPETAATPEQATSARSGRASEVIGAPLMIVWTAIGLAVVAVLLGARYQGLLPPLRGREGADPLTNHLAAVVDLGAQLSMLATFALLLAATFYSAGVRRHHELGERGRRFVRAAGSTAALWFSFSVLMIPLTAGENNGVSLLTVAQSLSPFIAATQPAQAWFAPAAIALIITLTARRIRRVGAVVLALLLGLAWQLAPVVTGNVSVGADHDFGTDAAIWASLAACVAVASAAAALITVDSDKDHVRGRRVLWTLAVAATVVVAGRIVVGWYELAGTSPLATGYGLFTVGIVALWALIALRAWFGLRRGVRSRVSLGVDVALGVLAVGLQTATAHMAPPRFLVPQPSAQINFLGYEINEAPTIAALILPGRPNLLLVTMSVAALILYVAAHLILARRKIDWPIGRTIAWVLGWALLLWVGSAGVWAYSGAAFSYHMLVHMTVNMIIPVLIVLGAPITLALRVLPTQPESEPMGLRDLINGLLNWKPLEYLMHPVVIGINFIGSAYAVYLSGLFEFLMRYHWGHQLMTLHFIISGLLFFGLIVGADRNPKELPHVAKLGFLFAAMPFHAFFAVILLSSDGIIGSNFYNGLDVAWMTDLYADQQMGGQYTWAIGEIPMLMVVIALVFQWFAQDSREAKRKDRAMDEGLDDSYEAYNEMLRKLAERSDR